MIVIALIFMFLINILTSGLLFAFRNSCPCLPHGPVAVRLWFATLNHPNLIYCLSCANFYFCVSCVYTCMYVCMYVPYGLMNECLWQIGTALRTSEMKAVVSQLSELEQPWNCPHGRPTVRHLLDMAQISSPAISTEVVNE